MVEEGMAGAACLACAGYGDRVLAVFGQQAVKEMATAASQLSSTCSFGRHSRQRQRDGYNEFRVAREVFHKIQAQYPRFCHMRRSQYSELCKCNRHLADARGDEGSSCSCTDFFSHEKMRTREAIVIQHKVIIDAMLDELQLPKSTSEIVINTHGTVIVTIVFFPSTKSLHQSFRP